MLGPDRVGQLETAGVGEAIRALAEADRRRGRTAWQSSGLDLAALDLVLDGSVAGSGVHGGAVEGEGQGAGSDAGRWELKRLRAAGLRHHRGRSRAPKFPRPRRHRPESGPGSGVTVEAGHAPEPQAEAPAGQRRGVRPSARVGRNRRRAVLLVLILAGAVCYLAAGPVFNGATLIGAVLLLAGTAGIVLQTGTMK